MKLKVIRRERTGDATIGELLVNGKWFSWTLEDAVRDAKVQDRTAIPAGLYRVILNQSKRFGREMPLLLGVPEFDGIRIHAGNTAQDTKGCILVGYTRRENAIADSRDCFEALLERLQAVPEGEPILLEVLQPEAWPTWRGRFPEPASAPVALVPPVAATPPEPIPAPAPAPAAPVATPSPAPAFAAPPAVHVSTPDDAPMHVVEDEGTAAATRWVAQVVSIGTGLWAYFQNNPRLLLIMVGVLMVVTVAWFYRSTVLNREKLRINADPTKFNVR